jgi:hypothetical protein
MYNQSIIIIIIENNRVLVVPIPVWVVTMHVLKIPAAE